MRERRLRFDALVRALRDPGTLSALDAPDVDALVALADTHRVTGQLAEAFRSAQLTVPQQLVAAGHAALLEHLRTLRTLSKVAGALDGTGIAWLVVKGPVLAVRWYGDPRAPRVPRSRRRGGPALLPVCGRRARSGPASQR